MTTIIGVTGREIIDCRGYPTVEVDVTLESGSRGRASVPSGVTISRNEAVDLRDGHEVRFRGRGVRHAVEAVNGEITDALVGLDVEEQDEIDHTMIALDGTPDKARLGANAILGVSLAVAQAGAATSGLPLYRYLGGPGAHVLPVPLMNVIIGGVHAGNAIDFQEVMIAPVGAPTFAEAVRVGAEVFHTLRAELHSTTVGDEGGFAPHLRHNVAALELLVDVIEKSGYEPGREVALLVDAAASEFYRDGHYTYAGEGRARTTEEHVSHLVELTAKFPLVSIEDPMAHDDHAGWRLVTDALGDRCQLVGDDLFCTNVHLLAEGIELGIANSILVKVSQIGTLTETMAAARKAHESGYTAVVSHRSGETEDTTIADLAVALNCGQFKAGAPSRSDRTAKYNQLIRIEEELGERARYAGATTFRRG